MSRETRIFSINIFAVWIAAIFVCLQLLNGCKTPSGLISWAAAAPDGRQTVKGQAVKDKVILTAADTIDAAVLGLPVAVPVNLQTAAQRQAIATAPAGDVAALVAEFRDAVAQRDKIILEQAAEIARLKSDAGKFERRIFYGGAALLVTLAALVCFLGGSLPIIGPMVGPHAGAALGAAGAGLFGLGMAYDFAQEHKTAIGRIIFAALVAAGALIYSNAHGAGLVGRLLGGLRAKLGAGLAAFRGLFAHRPQIAPIPAAPILAPASPTPPPSIAPAAESPANEAGGRSDHP